MFYYISKDDWNIEYQGICIHTLYSFCRSCAESSIVCWCMLKRDHVFQLEGSHRSNTPNKQTNNEIFIVSNQDHAVGTRLRYIIRKVGTQINHRNDLVAPCHDAVHPGRRARQTRELMGRRHDLA